MLPQTMKKRILGRIRRFEPGNAVKAEDFLGVVSRGSIDMALSSLVRDSQLRRILRGLYDNPNRRPHRARLLRCERSSFAKAVAEVYAAVFDRTTEIFTR